MNRKDLENEVIDVISSIAHDFEGPEDCYFETALSVMDGYLTGEALEAWKALTPAERIALAETACKKIFG